MSDFSIDFVSDVQCEHLLVEISYKGQRLCVLNKEHGNEFIEIEFVDDLYVLSKKIEMKFSLSEFLIVLAKTKEELRSCS